jgi:hypothetical protein
MSGTRFELMVFVPANDKVNGKAIHEKLSKNRKIY